MAGSVDIAFDGSEKAPIHGHVVVGTTPTALAPTGLAKDRITRGVLIRAPGNTDDQPNTAVVYVGAANVSPDYNPATGGIPLPPRCTITLPCRNPSLVFVVAKSGTQDVAWAAI